MFCHLQLHVQLVDLMFYISYHYTIEQICPSKEDILAEDQSYSAT